LSGPEAVDLDLLLLFTGRSTLPLSGSPRHPWDNRRVKRGYARVLVLVAAVLCPGVLAAQGAALDVCDIRTPARVVAIGDVHGAYDQFLGILREAGLTDQRGQWRGGRAILVQTGDVLDRGADSRRVLDLLRRLEREAARAGGAVHALLGNHEVMRMVGDWRYVSTGELEAFRTADSSELRNRVYAAVEKDAAARAEQEQRPHVEAQFREQFMKEVPLGFIEMRQGFSPAGAYGKWLRERPVTVKINGVMYLHGGVSAGDAVLGCAGLNDAVRRDLAIANPSQAQIAAMKATMDTGPLWYRGLAQEREEPFEPTVTAILQQLGARAIVVGHTPAGSFRVASRFGGRVVQIDTGMVGGSFYPGGAPSALDVQGGTATAIYLSSRERVPLAADQVNAPSTTP
jgi:hypothetical protein